MCFQVGQEVAVGALHFEVAGVDSQSLSGSSEHLVSPGAPGVATRPGWGCCCPVTEASTWMRSVSLPESSGSGGVHREVWLFPERGTARSIPFLLLRPCVAKGRWPGVGAHVAEGSSRSPVAAMSWSVLMAVCHPTAGHHPIGGPQRVGGWAALPDRQGPGKAAVHGPRVEALCCPGTGKGFPGIAPACPRSGSPCPEEGFSRRLVTRYLRERVSCRAISARAGRSAARKCRGRPLSCHPFAQGPYAAKT